MVAGGLDPQRVEAMAGDTLELEIWTIGSTSPTRRTVTVPGKRAPKVVRTSPPPRKRDVALNAAIAIVFSEPIDAATLTTASIYLLRAGSPVSGEVLIGDPENLTAVFQPTTPLVARTDYQLVVAQAIRDLDGEALDSAVTVDFTTGSSSTPSASSLRVIPDTIRALVSAGSVVVADIHAMFVDANGNAHPEILPEWSSSDSTVVYPAGSWIRDGRNTVQLVHSGTGSATITARSGAAQGTATVILEHAALSAVSISHNVVGPTCYLTVAGDAYCETKGYNPDGAAGSDVLGSQIPVRVTGRVKFTALTTSFWHACGVASTGAAFCWGQNSFGQAGSPPRYAVTAPTPVWGGLIFRQLSAGPNHTCGIGESGRAFCWGVLWGEESIGRSPPGPVSYTPVEVPGGLTFTEISSGSAHTCGITDGGAIYCWGINTDGQLGTASSISSTAPARIASPVRFVDVSAGYSHTCAVSVEGAVYCWGSEGPSWGPAYGRSMPAPQQVTLPAGVLLTTISVGAGPTCGLTADGAAYCWGFYYSNDGQDVIWVAPTMVSGGLEFASVTSGGGLSCGVTREPEIHCWYFGYGGTFKAVGQP